MSVSGYIVADGCKEGGRAILISRGTKAAVGIEGPNTHKLGLIAGAERGWVERTGSPTHWFCGLALILSRSSSSNARHQYFLVTLLSLSRRIPLPLFQTCPTTAKAAAAVAVVATRSSIVPITVLRARVRTYSLFERIPPWWGATGCRFRGVAP